MCFWIQPVTRHGLNPEKIVLAATWRRAGVCERCAHVQFIAVIHKRLKKKTERKSLRLLQIFTHETLAKAEGGPRRRTLSSTWPAKQNEIFAKAVLG